MAEPEHAERAVGARAREKDGGHVWNAHVPQARKAGIAAEPIDAVRDRRPVDGFPGPERAVVLYVRQLLQDNRVESGVFDQLLKAHEPKWLVELTSWIGRYAALSGILNAFEVTPGAPVDALPAVPRSAAASTKARPPLAVPRITPITRRDQVPEEHRSIFDAVAQGPRSVRGPFSILMYSPELCRRHLDVGTYLRFNSQVKPESRELAIIATAREKEWPYVWAAHAPAARKAGVSNAAVIAVRDRGDLASLPAGERDTRSEERRVGKECR